jgi:lauroyl/myristoyl acyltransferase/predicted metal-dependent phosphoesterase TrpH
LDLEHDPSSYVPPSISTIDKVTSRSNAMAQPSSGVDALVHGALAIASRITAVIPWPVWHLLASAIGFVAMFFGWRRTVLANVRHARANNPPRWWVAWFLGMQQIASHIKTVIGILQASRDKTTTSDALIVDGGEHLEPHLGQRGIIIVAPHAGPYPTIGIMASRWLHEESFHGDIAVIVRLFEPLGSLALMKWFARCFLNAGATVISADAPPRQMARQLRSVLSSKGIVVLLVDEPTSTPSMIVPFFDSVIRMPVGPARLARVTDSVIIPAIATYGRGRKVTLRIAESIEPSGDISDTLAQVGQALERLITQHLDQWSMLTPIWAESIAGPAPAGQSYADLHLHTIGSDGLCIVNDWSKQASETSLALIAVTDHDHIATVRRWHEAHRDLSDNVLPGVEITARGRIVHIGILFPREVPTELPKPGTPLLQVMRWARSIDGSLVVLVHPLPGLWRIQLRRLARAGLLPDAIETHFPLAFWRTPSIERAAEKYGIARVGGTDAHLIPDQLGRYVTQFPGDSVEDLVSAIRSRTTQGVTRPVDSHPPLSVYALQSIYSWLLPFRALPKVATARERLLMAARKRAIGSSHVRSHTPKTITVAAEEGSATTSEIADD